MVLLAVGWLLFLITRPGKLATLMLVALVPLGGWLYARARVPRHTRTIVGGALGFVAYPFGRGLISLLLLPMPFQLLGIPGLILEVLHGLPGQLVAFYVNLELQTDTGPDTVFIVFLNGIVWAAVYGCVGHLLDRRRVARAR